jgi:hypothetical protein
MRKVNKHEIIITIEGGLIQDVNIPKGCKIRVKVMDFDVEGIESERVKTNKAGQEYVESYWKIA